MIGRGLEHCPTMAYGMYLSAVGHGITKFPKSKPLLLASWRVEVRIDQLFHGH